MFRRISVKNKECVWSSLHALRPCRTVRASEANRGIGEALKTMLLESNMESHFWAEAAAMYV